METQHGTLLSIVCVCAHVCTRHTFVHRVCSRMRGQWDTPPSGENKASKAPAATSHHAFISSHPALKSVTYIYKWEGGVAIFNFFSIFSDCIFTLQSRLIFTPIFVSPFNLKYNSQAILCRTCDWELWPDQSVFWTVCVCGLCGLSPMTCGNAPGLGSHVCV